MKILVGSVFAEGNRTWPVPNDKWIKLQLHYLNKTSPDYDHAVAVCGDIDESLFKNSYIFSRYHETSQAGYVEQIKNMIAFFRENAKKYDGFLILDSDAFPVHSNWFGTLVSHMIKLDKWYASPMRIENLDSWPHLCCAFIRPEFINNDFLTITNCGFTNIYGEKGSNDIGPENKVVIEGKQIWLPLTRSNVWNPHPVACGVYSHMFYHHGGGSRYNVFRGQKSLMFNERVIVHPKELQMQLFCNSDLFINSLMGIQKSKKHFL